MFMSITAIPPITIAKPVNQRMRLRKRPRDAQPANDESVLRNIMTPACLTNCLSLTANNLLQK